MARDTRPRREDRLAQYEAPTYRELLERLAQNLRVLRRERGWTQEEAAERCGVSTRYLQALELQEKNFTATTLARLCDGFGLDASDLLRRPPQRRKHTAKRA